LNFGAWTKQFEQEHYGCVGDDLFDISEEQSNQQPAVGMLLIRAVETYDSPIPSPLTSQQ